MAHAATAAGPSAAPPLDPGVRIRLSVMMLLQFGIWGSWAVIFYDYLVVRKFNDWQASLITGNMALGAILTMFFAGYIADRLVASERLMAFCHLAGAGLLYWIAQIQSPDQFWLLFVVSLAYALLYNPTLAVSNSIAFTHVPDATRDFPGIRVLGTLGWIVVGFLIDLLFSGPDSPTSRSNGPLLLAAGLSAALGVFSLFLPHTPPSGKAGDAIPFVKALKLFRDPSFAVFFVVSLVITVVLAFYYTITSNFLKEAAGVNRIGSTMLIGQVAELVLLPLLPLFLWRLGMKWVLALGMLAWGVRYALFAYGGPEGLAFALVILGVALHGFCFDFFFAAGFIHVDNEAPKDIRASGQALFSFLTYGVGMWLGALLCGKVKEFFTLAVRDPNTGAITQTVDWKAFWLVPSLGVLASLLVFVLFFHMRSKGTRHAPIELGEVALPVGGEPGVTAVPNA